MSSGPLGVVLDRFIRTSPGVRNLNFRLSATNRTHQDVF